MRSFQKAYNCIALLIVYTSIGQISQSVGLDSPMQAEKIYYPFYNGIQMIEIDYNGVEKSKIDLLDAVKPISSIRQRHYSHNTIILRNKRGDLLHQYNLKGAPFKSSDFIGTDQPFSKASHLQKITGNREARSNYPSYGKYNLYVVENNKAGIIDTLGNKVLDVIYDGIQPYVCNDKKIFYHLSGYRDDFKDDDLFYIVKLNGKWGLKNRKINIEPKYEELIPFKENVLKFRSSSKYGLMDYKEKILLAPTYTELRYKNNFYLYSTSIQRNAEQADVSYGIINSNFDIISQPVYTNIEDIIENYEASGKYWACKAEGCGVLGENGFEESKFKYGAVPAKPYNYYRTHRFGDPNRICILDSSFKEMGPGYDAVYEWNTELFIVRKNKKQGLADITGKIVLPCEYDAVKTSTDGFGIIIKDNLYGAINSKGTVIVPCNYNHLYFTNNRIIVAVNTDDATADKAKNGLLDYQGKLIVPAIYDKLEFIDSTLLKAQMKQSCGIIDNQGRQITPIKYDDIFSFRNGFCIAKIDFGYGYINSSGKEITHFYYGKPTNFEYDSKNKLIAKAYLNDQEITIDENGNVLK